jgi:dienelactone hydrolase
MKKCLFFVIKTGLVLTVVLLMFSSNKQKRELHTAQLSPILITDSAKQARHLEKLLRWLPPDRTQNGRVSFLDETFADWLARTGELPPDFDNMPSIPFLPDPLVMDEGVKDIPVRTMAQWNEKREWMRLHLEYYITGTRPPAPGNLMATVLSEKADGGVTSRMVELRFGPGHRAKLTVELIIPPGEGPFPVFLTQWDHRDWAQIAVRRGYIGCIYAGGDGNDDTEEYSEIWAGEYDFTRLMRRAYGASRAIDYLYTLPIADTEKIGITGHSRNGKQSLIAAAFDERITACIPGSGGTGAEVPWRYTSHNFDVEDIALLACAQPAWLHPRLRFFTGHEHKLPVDQNHLMALIAPRGLMLSTALTEGASNPWGNEQVYHASRRVYDFLGAGDNLAISSRFGEHYLNGGIMEEYVDFFDYIFGRSDRKPENRLYHSYSFEEWRELSREHINPPDYPVRGIEDIDRDSQNNIIGTVSGWERKRSDINSNLEWLLGDEPPGVANPGPGSIDMGGRGEVTFGTLLVRPRATPGRGVMSISSYWQYKGFGDKLFGYLYYPVDDKGNLTGSDLPVVIYLHEYDYSKGFSSYHRIEELIQSMVDRGYCVLAYDMLGFGTRIEEGTHFYNRYPHWSKMGKMVTDARGAVEAMVNLDFIDGSRVYIAGYSLGATVGLYTAALDRRVAGVVSVAGFTPMRLNTADRGTEGILAWSHLHGLLPRLGFFAGNEARIPVDFHEVLASIAPRPLLVIAPEYDKDAHTADIRLSVAQAGKIYSLLGSPENIELFTPDDYNRFSNEMRERMYRWLQER